MCHYMIPLFKSHYSIGKSILTLNPPGSSDPSGPDSIFDILLDNKINNLFLIEDVPTGFLAARKQSFANDIKFIFGLRMSFCCQLNEEPSQHKCIIIAKSDNGCKLLNIIYSDIFCNFSGVGNFNLLKKYWSDADLMLCIPFYDSFLYKNSFTFSSCAPDFSFCDPIFFTESNGLPIDSYLLDLVKTYCSKYGYQTLNSKSIYYKNRDDVEALQTYKCICNRSFGRNKSLSNPMLEGFGSDEFCFESWLESQS